MKPRVLITGFGRFPGAPANPTGALARTLAARRRPALSGLDRHAEILPTLWAQARDADALLERVDPDIVLMLGLAARRRQVCIETLALNAARGFPDAARHRPAGRRLDAKGVPAIDCNASAPALLAALRSTRLPARLSRDAGRYVCNALAYTVYRHAREHGRPRLAVFVHIPLPDARRLSPRALERGLEALLIALRAQFRATASR